MCGSRSSWSSSCNGRAVSRVDLLWLLAILILLGLVVLPRLREVPCNTVARRAGVPATVDSADHPMSARDVWNLPDEEYEEFLRGTVQLVGFHVRPRVGSCRYCPVVVTYNERMPTSDDEHDHWYATVFVSSVRCDGVEVYSGQGAAVADTWRDNSSFGLHFSIDEVGTHGLVADVIVSVYYGGSVACMSDPLHRRVEQLRATVEVLPEEPPDSVRLVYSESLDDAVRRAICLRGVSPLGDVEQRALIFQIEITSPPPCGLAFNVKAEWAGGSVRMGKVTASEARQWYTDAPLCARVDAEIPDRVDVVLTSSVQAARETVDLTAIWGGKITFRDVSVVHLDGAAVGPKPGALFLPTSAGRVDGE